MKTPSLSIEEFDDELAMKGIKRMDLTKVMDDWEKLFKFMEIEHDDVMFHFDITDRNREMFEKLGEVGGLTSGQQRSFMDCGKCIFYRNHFVVGYRRGDRVLKKVFLRILREYN